MMATATILPGQIEFLIQEAVQTAFPDLDCVGKIIPLVRFERGHIGTDVAQQIAALYKISPEQIANKIIPVLQAACTSQVMFDEGFINFRFQELDWKLLEWKAPIHSQRHAILVTAFVETIGIEEYIRLLAFATMQVLHLVRFGAVAEVTSNGAVHTIKDRDAAIEFFYAQLESIYGERKTRVDSICAADQIIQFLAAQYPLATVWLAPRTLARKRYTELFKKYAIQEVVFQCPPRSLLSGGDLTDLPALLTKRLPALLLYLASDIHSQDLDLFTPQSCENSNATWFAEMIIERARRLDLYSNSSDLYSFSFALEVLSPLEQECLIRACQLERFAWHAATSGAVVEWYAGFVALLESTNRLLNSPSQRMCYVMGENSPLQTKIITGVLKSVSDMISLWKDLDVRCRFPDQE